MKILMTGASGFVGSHVFQKLMAQQTELHLLLRATSSRPHTHPTAAIIHTYPAADDIQPLIALMKEQRFDAIVHLAALFIAEHTPSDIAPLLDANVKLTAQLAEAAVLAKVPAFVFTGSSWEHTGDNGSAAQSFYAASKQAAQTILRYYADRHGLRVATLSLFDTYGPNDKRGKLLSAFKRAMRTKETLAMSAGEQLIDLTHATDVAEAYATTLVLLQSAEAGFYKEYGIASGRRISLRDLAALYENITQDTLPIAWGTRPYRQGEIMMPWTNYEHLPNWQPRISLEEGIRQLLEEPAHV